MRWERLFQDLEDQLERETDAELEDLARDEERLRIARLTLADRLRDASSPHFTREVTISLSHVTLVCRVLRVGRDWALVHITSPVARVGTALLPTSAIRSLACDPVDSRAHSGGSRVGTRDEAGRASSARASSAGISSDIGIVFVLRDLCRRRRQVALLRDEHEVTGTIERVGKDHLDLAVHPAHHPRTVDAVVSVTVFALDHVELIVLV